MHLPPRFIVTLFDENGSPLRVVLYRQQLRNLLKAAQAITDFQGDAQLDHVRSGDVSIERVLSDTGGESLANED